MKNKGFVLETVGITVALILVLAFFSFGTISAGQRGVKTRLGAVVEGTLSPGFYAKVPFLESVHKIDVKTRTVSFDNGKATGDDSEFSSLAAASSDLQDVAIATVVNYHVDPSKVADIFQQYGDSYEGSVIQPLIRDTVKSTASLYTAEELVTKRAEFAQKVQLTLSEKLSTKDAVVEQVNITNFEFSKSFSDAIEAKVTAVQHAEAAKNKLEQIKFEAQQTIETAKATAEAQRIQSQSLAAQGGKDYVDLKAIEKWDGKLPAQMIPGSSVPFLNLK